MQALDSVEFEIVRKKIADLQVTTQVQHLIGYQLPDFVSVTSAQSDNNSRFLNNSAQYEAEFNFMSKFEPAEQIVIQKVRYEQQLHTLKLSVFSQAKQIEHLRNLAKDLRLKVIRQEQFEK